MAKANSSNGRTQLPRPRGSAAWCDYFRINGRRLLPVDWQRAGEFTKAERAAVTRSIQIFQLGESGEGRHFLACAEEYVRRADDPDYLIALPLFLAEEHRHARDLGRVLDAMGEQRLKKNWTDRAFRWLRHRGGLELTISVLLTAEVVAQVYYQALRDATGNPALRMLCRQILSDEVRHVQFQAERLALLRTRQSRWRIGCAQFAERCLFAVTCRLVWFTHRSVFRAAAMSWPIFRHRMNKRFRTAQRIGNPASYVNGLVNGAGVMDEANAVGPDSWSYQLNHHELGESAIRRVPQAGPRLREQERWLD